MAKKNKYQKAKNELKLRKNAGMPAWLFMTLSFVVPVYGFIYYFISKDYDIKKSRVALFFATLGAIVMLILKLIVWTN